MSQDTIERDPRLRVQEEGLRGLWHAGLSRARTGDLGSLPIVLGLVVIWALFQTQNGNFLSPRNIVELARFQIPGIGFLALGSVLVLLLGEVDLSVGPLAGFAAGVLGVTLITHGVWVGLAVVLSLLAGAAGGFVQGFLFTFFNVPSFVVTLAGLIAWQGALLYILGNEGTVTFPFNEAISSITVTFFGSVVAWIFAVVVVALYVLLALRSRMQQRNATLPVDPWATLVFRTVLIAVILFLGVWEMERDRGVPVPFVVFMGFIVLFSFILTSTRYGRHIFAVGGNAEAARRAGIGVTGIRVSVFTLAGFLSAIGGLLLASKIGSVGQGSADPNNTLEAIAAAVIGGTSLFGGRGSAWSAFLGILVIGSIYNGLDLLGVSSALHFLITGGVLVASAVIDAVARRGRQARPGVKRRVCLDVP